MNIGIDIDDTITNSSEVFIKYAKLYNKKNEIKHTINTNELEQKKAFGWNRRNQKKFASQYLKSILEEAKPNDNVIKSIKKLRSLGYKIIFITARSDAEVYCIYELTKRWLIENEIEFDKLIVNCSDKLEECLKNDIKLFIDDNYKTCKKVNRTKKIKVFLYETKYNRKYNNLDMIRVKNWNEIMKRIEEEI